MHAFRGMRELPRRPFDGHYPRSAAGGVGRRRLPDALDAALCDQPRRRGQGRPRGVDAALRRRLFPRLFRRSRRGRHPRSRTAACRGRRARKLPPRRRPRKNHRHGARCRRTLLRTSVAGPAGRTLRPPDSGRCDRGRSALRLPGLHARRLAPLPRQGVRQAAAGPLGPLQIQPLPLAPDRRRRLAHRDQEIPRPYRHRPHGGPIPTGRGGTSAANATAAATIRRPMAATIRRTKSARWSNTPAPCISR